MASALATALLPIIVTLVLGFFAGWHHDFSADQAGVLNRMVMLYALPLSLFAGMVTVKRGELVSDVPMALMIAGTMVVVFFAVILVVRFAFHQDIGSAALWGLAIGGPAVPFVGTPVLGSLLGQATATIPIAVASLTMNLIQVPVTIVLLSMSQMKAGDHPKGAAGPAGVGGHVAEAIKEPVVWAPLAALVLVLVGVHVPDVVHSSLTLLGTATGGVALFASGVVLYAQKVAFTPSVGVAVALRNIAVPLAVWGLCLAFGLSAANTESSVLSMAIPTASIAVILAVQYRRAEKSMASVLFISTVASAVTMAGFIVLTS